MAGRRRRWGESAAPTTGPLVFYQMPHQIDTLSHPQCMFICQFATDAWATVPTYQGHDETKIIELKGEIKIETESR